MSSPEPRRCEWPHCTKMARAQVRGAWTVFDWYDLDVCYDHTLDARHWLERRTVDGHHVQELTTEYWQI